MTSDEKQTISNCITEMLDSYHRTAAERSLQKEITARVKEETTVTPRIFRKMARAAFAANFSEEQATFEEFETLYTEIFPGA